MYLQSGSMEDIALRPAGKDANKPSTSYVAHRTEPVAVRRIIKHVSVNLHSDFLK
jgi:hypothetical protein